MGLLKTTKSVNDVVDMLITKYRTDYSKSVYVEFKDRATEIFNDYLIGRIDDRDCIIRIGALDSEFTRSFTKVIKK